MRKVGVDRLDLVQLHWWGLLRCVGSSVLSKQCCQVTGLSEGWCTRLWLV